MKRKCVLAAGIMLLLMAAEGCGNGQETAGCADSRGNGVRRA